VNSHSSKKTWTSILAGLLVVTAFVLVVEVVLSKTHLFGARKSWTRPDPLIGWRYEPGARYWFDEENRHPIEGRINNHGWRDRDRTLEKSPGTFRIAVIGDSFVEAFQVEEDVTFTALVEERLNNLSDTPVEVMNFGRSGTTQSEQLLILEHDVLPFDPDLVVVVFLPINDIDEVSPATAGDPLRPFYHMSKDGRLTLDTSFTERRAYRLKQLINPLKQHSAIVSLVVERYNRLRASRHAAGSNNAPDRIGGARSLCTSSPEPRYAENYALNKRLLEEMKQVWNGPIMLVCTNWTYTTEDIAHYTSIDPSFDPRFFERDLAGLAEGVGMDYVELQTVFEAYYRENLEPLHWQHWNYAGHRVVADVLTEALSGKVAR
jgi:lysophospholipase L1-like esterase